MRATIFILAASARVLSTSAAPQANYATSGTAGGVVPVGGDCVPDQDTCALGSHCYATNFMLQPRCGNFQAACTINEQCASNTCNVQQGLCDGFLSSSGGPSSTISASSCSDLGPAMVTVTTSSRSATEKTTISSTRTVTAATTVRGMGNGTITVGLTGSLRPTGSGRPSGNVVPYTGGAASIVGAGSGLVAAIFAVGAWAL